MILLDSDVISALMHAEREPMVVKWLDGQPRLSVWVTAISVMEIRFGLRTMPPGRRQDELLRSFEIFLEARIQGRVAPFDQAGAEQAAVLMSSRKLRGRPVDVKDAMIAGIAQAAGATLATRNASHFADLAVPVVNPWEA